MFVFFFSTRSTKLITIQTIRNLPKTKSIVKSAIVVAKKNPEILQHLITGTNDEKEVKSKILKIDFKIYPHFFKFFWA